ncbi:hypothetical protein PHYSODRAFT_307997 [Phytophthora sojae]|uniref:Uncharacterized protein n=1 Tax=Phytophthora sojae (strain P6497) TaxID=1094619 RepID=G5AHM7_PHYSP|nr:hypothetical protein PHYSODRAFT_307997 [Phytophthora sojae]EGZ04948.1 hypothetical protein PHYSODRAFT_307997 [Phytophthora sojae]|eukprot:XP_009539578.1 hypothetical protein PHYSODRAFT_307997 [Phytophthora sojae]
MLAAGETAASELLMMVLDWSLTRPTPAHWIVLFCVAIARYHEDEEEVTEFLPVLELLATKNPAPMVDILRDLLDECVANDEVSVGPGLSALNVVSRLVALARLDGAFAVKSEGVRVVATGCSFRGLIPEEVLEFAGSECLRSLINDDCVPSAGARRRRCALSVVMFASVWLDAPLSTTSATNIPTHFPNGVNFADMDKDGDQLDERQVIMNRAPPPRP